MLIVGGVLAVSMALLYRFYYELFIVSTLIINHEFFFLAPREPLGTANYQDALFVVLPLTLTAYIFKRIKTPRDIRMLVLAFFAIILVSVLTSTFQGQPLTLGLKAAKGYYLLLFYFSFTSRPINVQRLTRIIVLTGTLLMFLNNLQYIGWGSIQLFQYTREVDLERGGQLRFLMGDFFTIFAPITALGAYLQQRQKWYLVAFLYMSATVFIQGQTRSVIFGLIMTTFVLLFLSQRIRLKMFLSSLGLILSFVLIEPMSQNTFVTNLFQETTMELTKKSGNVGIRYDSYAYYLNELSNNIVIGRGIWNDAFTGFNPENMKDQNFYLSDVGIMKFIFHTGLLGVIWLGMLLYRVYQKHFESIGRLKEQISYGVVGYFIFSISTLVTLDSMVDRFTIIYLALVLAIISQYKYMPTQRVTA